jgi:hypothetical protein
LVADLAEVLGYSALQACYLQLLKNREFQVGFNPDDEESLGRQSG